MPIPNKLTAVNANFTKTNSYFILVIKQVNDKEIFIKIYLSITYDFKILIFYQWKNDLDD